MSFGTEITNTMPNIILKNYQPYLPGLGKTCNFHRGKLLYLRNCAISGKNIG